MLRHFYAVVDQQEDENIKYYFIRLCSEVHEYFADFDGEFGVFGKGVLYGDAGAESRGAGVFALEDDYVRMFDVNVLVEKLF